MCHSLSPPGSRLRLYQCVTHSLPPDHGSGYTNVSLTLSPRITAQTIPMCYSLSPPDHGSDYTNVLLTLSPRITAQTIPMCYSLSPPGSRLRLYQCVTHSLSLPGSRLRLYQCVTHSLPPDHGSDYTNVLLTLSPRITAQTIPMCHSLSPPLNLLVGCVWFVELCD